MMWLILAISVAVVVLWLLVRWKKGSTRRRLLRQPFPQPWKEILRHTVPLYRILPEPLQKELEGHMLVFLHEKNFEGAGGLRMTDEVRVTISAYACLLLLNRRSQYYPHLYSIIVYPGAYVTKTVEHEGDLEYIDQEPLQGEAWEHGAVVFSWNDILHGRSQDGSNVGIHEFAHQLDFEDGAADGVPILEKSDQYVHWKQVMSSEFEASRKRTARGTRSVLDSYGATDPSEFFAVATEAFFERPIALRKKYPALYAELQQYYHLDPAAWYD
ncbi:MAG TPA: zinc-dependent peptidase [Thermodesulfobacteriota bacterium]|nr:zinc-dependent peptidase [Deltaproteobacteria bacterium]HNR12198.1 zinc-dependent peptidase [Thermodesulfobacteriota bacterium]HNU71275.1 zinc-dependent peptidase [Thermodesulfobacteriota bacterium]HOC38371.1 zinc-dependent peptidase [Thermodesulfobacteriota bacterium]